MCAKTCRSRSYDKTAGCFCVFEDVWRQVLLRHLNDAPSRFMYLEEIYSNVMAMLTFCMSWNQSLLPPPPPPAPIPTTQSCMFSWLVRPSLQQCHMYAECKCAGNNHEASKWVCHLHVEWERACVGWPGMVCLVCGKCVPSCWMTNVKVLIMFATPAGWRKVINDSICLGTKGTIEFDKVTSSREDPC